MKQCGYLEAIDHSCIKTDSTCTFDPKSCPKLKADRKGIRELKREAEEEK